jgi:hypothetical protein
MPSDEAIDLLAEAITEGPGFACGIKVYSNNGARADRDIGHAMGLGSGLSAVFLPWCDKHRLLCILSRRPSRVKHTRGCTTKCMYY